VNISLRGKHALVGGASRGIGKATARELARNGANVTCIARNEEALRAVVKNLDRSAGQEHQYIAGDSSRPDELAIKIAALVETNPVNIVVNNTGGPPDGPAYSASGGEYQLAFTQHLLCNQAILQAVLPGMRESGFGRIINVISTSVKQPIPGLGVSNTIRGAVANWAKTLASELGPLGITVNNVLPGFTETDRLEDIIQRKAVRLDQSADSIAILMRDSVPLKRFGLPEETAAAIVFLASPSASYINGINLPVDGGRTSCL